MTKFTLRHSDKFVGLFVLAGTLALVLSLAYVGINKRWFQRDLEYRSYFTTAEGLNPGLDLELRGFAIGRVKSMTLGKDNQVELVLTVFDEYADHIVAGSVVSLTVSPMGFGSNLVLYPGLNSAALLPGGAVIPSSDSPTGQDLLAQGLVDRPQRRDEVTNLLGTLPPLLNKVDGFIVTMDSLMGHMDQRLMGIGNVAGAGLMGTANGALVTMDATTRQFGAVAVRLDSLTTQVDLALRGMNGILSAPEGMVPALMGTEGSAAQLFRDEAQLYQGMIQIVEELRLMMNFLNQSTPEISVLMEESTNALVESEKVMQGLQNNPLLRGGIAPAAESGAVFEGHRQEVR